MIEYKKGYKYQLNKDLTFLTEIYPEVGIETSFISLTTTGLLFVKKGYAWDGASGPVVDRPSVMESSCIHDALYQLMRLDLLSREFKIPADELFRDISHSKGAWRWLTEIYLKALKRFGTSSTLAKNAKKVYRVP